MAAVSRAERPDFNPGEPFIKPFLLSSSQDREHKLIQKSIDILRQVLPGPLLQRFTPALAAAEGVIHGTDDGAASQRTAIFVFVIRVASAVIAFLSQVLLARWLGSYEYGIFVAIWVGLIVLGTLVSIGLPTASVRFVAEYRENGKDRLLRGIIFAAICISLVSATILAAAGAWVLTNFPHLVTGYFVTPMFIAAICVPMLALQNVLDGITRAFNWTAISFLPTYIVRPLGVLLVTGIALGIGFEPTAVTAMAAAIIAVYATSLGQYIAMMFRLHREVPSGPRQYRTVHWIAVALPIFLVEGFYVLQTSIDILFVSALTDPESTAIYFASAKVLALVHFVYFAVKAAVAHRFSALYTAGRLQELRDFVQRTVSWTFWPSAVLGLFMMITGKWFLMLFGTSFVAGETVLWILVLGIVIRASVGPAEALLVMSGRQKSCAMIYGTALGANVILNLALIPKFGLHGAAIATSSALAIESMALHISAKRSLGIHAFIIPERTASATVAG